MFPKERMAALCDGIFAITMTLMIIDLKIPENIPKELASEELPGAMYNLLSSIEAYVVSFVILGVFWIRHQLQFSFFSSIDRVISLINIVFLLLIGFVPFTVRLKEEYPDTQFAFWIYLANLFCITILLTIQWEYAVRKKIILRDELSPGLKKRFHMMSAIPIVLFLISFIISFFHLRFAFLIIYLVPLFYAFSKRVIKKRTVSG